MTSALTAASLFSRVGDMDPTEIKHTILFYGNSGAGKTHIVSTGPGVFIVVTEQQSVATIRRANPDAKIAVCNTMKDIRQIIRLAINGKLDGCRTLVFDGLTEIQQLFKDEILETKEGKDPEMTIKDWGTLTDRMRKFMRTIRDLPYDVAATALAEHQQSEGSAIRYVQPSLQGRKLPNEVAQNFSAVGYVFKRELADSDGNKTIVHKVMFDGPARIIAKSNGPVKGTMDPDLTAMFELLDAEAATQAKAANAA